MSDEKRNAVVEYLGEHPGCTTQEVGQHVKVYQGMFGRISGGYGPSIGYDQAHGILTRLAGKGVVRRFGRPAKWEAVNR